MVEEVEGLARCTVSGLEYLVVNKHIKGDNRELIRHISSKDIACLFIYDSSIKTLSFEYKNVTVFMVNSSLLLSIIYSLCFTSSEMDCLL